MREYLIGIVQNAYPCSCAESYTSRGLVAPDCFHCVPLAEAAARLADALAGETAWLLEYVNADANCIGYYSPVHAAGTDDPGQALRLSRRDDAEAVRGGLPDGHLLRSAEHVFMAAMAGDERGEDADSDL